MKIITGQIQPDSGSVEIGDTVHIGYFMQENEPLDENQTVLEFVRSIGEYVQTVDGKQQQARCVRSSCSRLSSSGHQ